MEEEDHEGDIKLRSGAWGTQKQRQMMAGGADVTVVLAEREQMMEEE